MPDYFSRNPLKSPAGSAFKGRGPRRASKLVLLLRAALRGIFVIALVAQPVVTWRTHAASERGRVEGVVNDPAGSKIAGARVLLRSIAGVIAYQATTDSEGRFSVSNVEEGNYKLMVEAPGFTQAGDTSVELRDGASQSVTVRLEIAAVSDQLVVSATRTETAQSELGGSASLITAGSLTREHQSLISESLRKIPGLSVVQTSGRGGLTSVFVRGGESDYNKVLIDGVPVNDAGGSFDFASLTPENIERVEIARGPNSAVFGSDAMTSVIQLISKRGDTSQPELEFSGEGGSFDFHRETTRLSGLNGLFDYSASFGYQTTGGRFRNTDYINRSASANLGFQLRPSADLRVTVRSNNGTLGIAGPTAQLFADPDQRQKHRDIAIGAVLDVNKSSRWRHTGRFVLAESETFSFDPAAEDLRNPNTPLLPPGAFADDFAFLFNNHQKRAGLQYQSIATIGNSNLLTGGVDFDHESAVFDDGFSRVSPTRNNLGLYLQDQFAVRDRLFVTAGVRVERNTAAVPEDLRALLVSFGSPAPSGEVGFGLSANPRIAAAFMARRHREGSAVGATRLKASFGTGIKEPKLDEAFGSSFFAIGNPRLDPERARSFEIGIAQDFFGRRANIDLTYFDGRFRDQIDFIFDPRTFGPVKLQDGTLTNFVNFDRASARGVELVGSARPARQLQLTGSYTFLGSRLEQAFDPNNKEVGLPLIRRPRHSGSLAAGWVAYRYDLSLDGSFVGRRRDIDPVFGARFDSNGLAIFNDGYAKLNAAGSYNFNRFLSMFARVENLLNASYQEVLGFPAYRLSFSAGLRVRVGGGK
ncbi:MAG TPA: TonB-dependent receptor [Blastocatellia bacterium]|nr:TonB-dependent receptor [Blastocatellia bacterium]